MTLETGAGLTNIVEFRKPDTANTKIQDNTIHQVNHILMSQKFTLNKSDIISTIVMGEGGTIDPKMVDSMLSMDYFDLYETLVDMICENVNPFYNSIGYKLFYEEKSLDLYLQNAHYESQISKLDINLLPNKNFSEITLELSYKGNVLFVANSQAAGRVNILPSEINKEESIDKYVYFDKISQVEKDLINKNTYNKNLIISAITSNFSNLIVSEDEIVNNLGDYTRFQLIELLIQMIVDNYGEQHDLIVNPFSSLLIQKTHNNYLENIDYELDIDPGTYLTRIKVKNEKGDILFSIGDNIVQFGL